MDRLEHMERVLRRRFGIASAAVVVFADKKNGRMTRNNCKGHQRLPSGSIAGSGCDYISRSQRTNARQGHSLPKGREKREEDNPQELALDNNNDRQWSWQTNEVQDESKLYR